MGRKSLIKWLVTFTSRKAVRLSARAFLSCRGGKLQVLLVLPFEGARLGGPEALGEPPSSLDAEEHTQPCSVPPGTPMVGATRAEREARGDAQGRAGHH